MKSKCINNLLIWQVSRENDRSIPVESLAKNTSDTTMTPLVLLLYKDKWLNGDRTHSLLHSRFVSS